MEQLIDLRPFVVVKNAKKGKFSAAIIFQETGETVCMGHENNADFIADLLCAEYSRQHEETKISDVLGNVGEKIEKKLASLERRVSSLEWRGL